MCMPNFHHWIIRKCVCQIDCVQWLMLWEVVHKPTLRDPQYVLLCRFMMQTLECNIYIFLWCKEFSWRPKQRWISYFFQNWKNDRNKTLKKFKSVSEAVFIIFYLDIVQTLMDHEGYIHLIQIKAWASLKLALFFFFLTMTASNLLTPSRLSAAATLALHLH